MWYAALPELMVFFFVLLSLLCWVRWLQSPRGSEAAYICTMAAYIVALFSKESAVAVPPLLLLAGLIDGKRLRVLVPRVLPFALCAILYFGLIFAARKTHLHFNDAGTFSLGAPFPAVLIRSGMHTTDGCMGLDGGGRIVVLETPATGSHSAVRGLVVGVTLLPYSFLTYMPRVPSRHTYLGSVGVAVLVSVWLIELHARIPHSYRTRAMAAISVLFIAHQCGYLWIRKQQQFAVRAEPMEKLVRLASESKSPIRVKCFPYGREIAELALRVRGADSKRPALVFDAWDAPDAVDFCFDPGQYAQRHSR
jgi:hypothetical protein